MNNSRTGGSESRVSDPVAQREVAGNPRSLRSSLLPSMRSAIAAARSSVRAAAMFFWCKT